MEKLRAAGLFGRELVPLSGSLAKRYNDCLKMLGVSSTKLKQFSIDGLGWSPEIALEKKDNYYLNIGEANTNAIVVSPDQRGKPVHMPSHSFDRDIMQAVFAAYEKEIRDITKDAALCLHLDQKIDAFYEPFDLLRYDKIEVTFEILNALDEKQKEQKQLIKEYQKGNNFIDREIHKRLLSFAKTYGDLRHRKLYLEPITLEVSSFYTRAFGGVFVLTDFIKDVLVFEDEEVFKKAIKDIDHDVLLFHKAHDELMVTLVSHLILESDLKKTMRTPRYERVKKQFFSEYLENPSHSVKEVLDSHLLFKKYLNTMDIEVQKKINGVEIYYQKKIVNRDIKMGDYIDEVYLKTLHQPHSSIEEEHEELIWKLLTKIAPKDPLHLYWYDKDQFYKAYASWEPSYQDWVIECILENNKNEKA